MSIEVRLLSSDTALFYDLARQHGGLFVQSFWCSAYSTSLKIAGIFNNGSLIGGFTLFETRLKGFKAWITPPFAQHCGLFYQTSTSDNTSKINSFHKSVMREVAGFLKSEGPSLIKLEWPPEVTDTQPLIWQGLDISPKYTYVIDLTRGEDELRKNADPKIRGLLEPRGLLLKSDTDPSTLMQLVKKTYAGKSVSINTMLAQLLVSSVHQHGQLLSSLATVNGEAVGAYVCAYYGDTCYYL
ncbi:MAG: hypothetical protein JNM00_10215, partial [Flavobacteriales bacterium]|nr:hypothetical protein [Flavobacteriales bacterium]